MIAAHIVRGLSLVSLISTKIFFNAGCKVSFDKEAYGVYYKESAAMIKKENAASGCGT